MGKQLHKSTRMSLVSCRSFVTLCSPCPKVSNTGGLGRMDGSTESAQDLDVLECLRKVALKLKRNEWKFLAVRLGLSKADVEDIVRSNPGDYSRQKTDMLMLWKRNFREYATAERLVRALKEFGIRNDEPPRRQAEDTIRPVTTTASTQFRPRVDHSPMTPRRPVTRSFLSSAVQIRGLPLPVHERDSTAARGLWRSGTESSRIPSVRNKESRWKRAVSAPPKKHGKITIEVDIQKLIMPQKGVNLQTDKIPNSDARAENPSVLPEISKKNANIKNPETIINSPRKMKCRCSIHRTSGNDDDDDSNDEAKNVIQDPFENLLLGLRDPFFRSLVNDSPTELDTAVDQLEKLKGVFVDEARLKCIQFVCRCTSLTGLDRLWENYQNGTLASVLQTLLETDQLLASIGACGVTFKTYVCELEYKQCRQALSEAVVRMRLKVTKSPKDLTSLVVNTLFFTKCRGIVHKETELLCPDSTRARLEMV